jgi:hypothetical protein
MNRMATRVFALIPCATFLIGGTLQATVLRSDKVEIPFAFNVSKHKTMPAGQYLVEQNTDSEIATLVNTKTGERIQMLSPHNMHHEGKAQLVFESDAAGHKLKAIS